jgi:hypothetical protein
MPEPRAPNLGRRMMMTLNKTNFCIGDNPGVILDQKLGGEELKNLILEEGNVFNNDLTYRTSRIDVYNDFQYKDIKNVLKYFKFCFKMPPPTSRIKNATLSLVAWVEYN